MRTYLSIMLFFLLSFTCVRAQDGNTLSNPMVIPVGTEAFNFTSDRNTTGYTNNYTGRPTNDIFYKFTIDRRMEVTMSHCGSILPDTYMSLLDASGKLLAYNDDYSGTDACSTSLHSYLKQELDAGTYYVVSEGYNNNGVIYTRISGVAVQIHGDTRQDAITAGTFSQSFKYSDTQNTVNYTNQHTARTSADVFYKFTLNKRMNVTMTHSGSTLSDTYMHLLDAGGNTITTNDDYSGDGRCASTLHSFIQRTLEPGTYYIVSEGYSGTGIIVTNITGYASEKFGYQDIPSAYSAEPEGVGASGGTFSVSSTGGVLCSVPIKVPTGVSGMQPSLAIVYNSQAGNGMLGWGCNLSGLSAITRGSKDIYHDGLAGAMAGADRDALYLNGQRLILSSGVAGQDGAVYRPESAPFTSITLRGTLADGYFEVLSSDGMIIRFGRNAGARLSYTSGSSTRVHSWHVDHWEDPLGNYMSCTYNKWSYMMYPNKITYGNNTRYSISSESNTVSFTYENRPNDPQPFIIGGVKGSMNYRLSRITCKTGNAVYRTYELAYNTTNDGSVTKFSRLTGVTEKNGTGDALPPVRLGWTYLPAFSQSCRTPAVRSTYVPLGVHDNTIAYSNQGYIAADMNNDGLDDLIGIFPYLNYSYYANSQNYKCSKTNIAFVNYATLNSLGNVEFSSGTYYDLGATFELHDWTLEHKGYSSIDFDGDGTNEILVPQTSINDDYKSIGFYFVGKTMNRSAFGYSLKCSSEMPLCATADFNNDGKGDVVFIEKGQDSGNYPGEVVGLNSGTSLYRASFNFNFPSKPEKLFTGDYNGDGLTDILVFYNGGYTIFWNKGYGISGSTFSNSYRTTGTNVGNVWRIWTGDFNGDGLSDFLLGSSMTSDWYFAMNNGNGTFTKQLACSLGVYDQDFTEKDDSRFNCQVYDFDLDGKSDVVITKAMYDKKSGFLQGSWGEFNTTYTYWMRSTGSALTIVRSATSKRDADALISNYVLGDFNGDGQPELLNYGYDCYNSTNANAEPAWRMYTNPSYTTGSGKVTTFTGDYGAQTNVVYASLANGGIYTQGTGTTYPMADCTLPLHVVKKIIESNGAAGSMTTDYRYGGMKLHKQGRGFLGFSSVTAENVTMGTVTESGVKTWNTTFYIPSASYTKTTLDGKMAESNVTMTVTDKGGKKYFAYPSTVTEKDPDGNTVTTTKQYNTTYGYITQEKVDFGGNMYKTMQYSDYVMLGKAYHPQQVTHIQKHADDEVAFTLKTKITYDAPTGLVKQTIENQNTSLPLTTDRTYDNYGNLLTEKKSGSGIVAVTQKYDYDASKRFVTKAYTSPASSVTAYTYDTWGNVLTETDESDATATDKQVTAHTYDDWGNHIATALPDGSSTEHLRGWNNSNTSKRFFTLTQGTGQPWVKTWYDNRGREVSTESIGPKSMSVKKTTTYNSKGQVTSEQVQTGNLTTSESYTYDGRRRVRSHTGSTGKTVSYSYGNRSVTTVTSGKTCTKTYDAWGGVKTSSDPVSSVTYTYSSVGQPKQINAGGSTYKMTYHDTGKQKTLSDPDTGTTTYTYDAAGRVIKQVNGRGKETTKDYTTDKLGRLTKSVTDGVTTTYTYGTSGNSLLRLTKEQMGNNYVSYAYDSKGRISTETRTIDGYGSVAFGYAYNTQGQLEGVTYPDNLVVSRNYDSYGNLQKITAGTQNVWELTGATGTVTTTKLGGTLTSTRTHTAKGLLSNLKTLKGSAVLHNMDFNFNIMTGNLISRTGMLAQTESFTYDNADRLTGVQQGSATVMNIGYQANGNISSKTGIGGYTYGTRPHAVATVDNTDGEISVNDQAITYTAFDKVASVSETVGSDSYLLNITYGPDRQRWRSVLKKNNAAARTIVFAGDYEIVTEGGVTKKMCYISSGDGLAAVYVKQLGQLDKVYYAHKDHLGSIVKLTDNTGVEAFKASYDAWGRRTVTNNNFKFHRGYTGHEHLDEFKLINMNGRMYDPLLARFLSPDPFVQMPDFSQSFNRYAYCVNNPLVYMDPSGEMAWFVPVIIGAAIGLYSGGVIANDGQFNPTKWDYSSGKTWGYMLGGAVVGGISGYAGWAVAGSGIPMANTAGIAAASLTNSIGTWAYTGGQTPISISLGVASYDFTNGTFGYLGKKGNKWYENLGYGLGALANVSDILIGFQPKNVDLVTEHSDNVGHSALVREGTTTGIENGLDPNALISVGPDWINSPENSTWHWLKGTNSWDSHSRAGEMIWRQNLRVNMNTIEKYSSWLNTRATAGKLVYSVELSSCVTHTSIALNLSGIFNVGIHPFLLNAQMYLWSNGIRPWTFSYFLNQ